MIRAYPDQINSLNMVYKYKKISPGLLFILAILFSRAASGLSVSANSMGSLPHILYESSGVDFTGGTHFWSHNDTQGDNNLYRIANDGSLTKTITVVNAHNKNWEDLTHDASRTYMYIGDFGNNNCDRTNLRVYRIPYP